VPSRVLTMLGVIAGRPRFRYGKGDSEHRPAAGWFSACQSPSEMAGSSNPLLPERRYCIRSYRSSFGT